MEKYEGRDKGNIILDLTDMLENELRTTYKGILEGKDWKDYMKISLNAYYKFIEWANEEGIIHFDLKAIKERDKVKYSKVFEELEV